MSIPARTCQDSGANLLVVEGIDDCHGIYQIARKHNIADTFGIWASGGDVSALERFSGLLVSSKLPKIMGIVLDTDALEGEGLARRWKQLRDRLEEFNYKFPAQPDAKGTILDAVHNLPRLGIWLMPNNQDEGMFEDFLLTLISASSQTLARRVVKLAQRSGHGNVRDIHLAKAMIHTYLAWQDEPGRPIGVAVKCGMLDSRDVRAIAFVTWLKDLFQV